MTVFFTADTHFGHSNVIRYDKRPFRDVTEMNEILIKNWNRTVGTSDTVYQGLGKSIIFNDISRLVGLAENLV